MGKLSARLWFVLPSLYVRYGKMNRFIATVNFGWNVNSKLFISFLI